MEPRRVQQICFVLRTQIFFIINKTDQLFGTACLYNLEWFWSANSTSLKRFVRYSQDVVDVETLPSPANKLKTKENLEKNRGRKHPPTSPKSRRLDKNEFQTGLAFYVGVKTPTTWDTFRASSVSTPSSSTASTTGSSRSTATTPWPFSPPDTWTSIFRIWTTTT